MPAALPFRSRVRNVAPATAAPAAFSLVAALATGPDACRVLLRSEPVGDLPAIRRHAFGVYATMRERHGAGVEVQVFNGDVPVFAIGGAL